MKYILQGREERKHSERGTKLGPFITFENLGLVHTCGMWQAPSTIGGSGGSGAGADAIVVVVDNVPERNKTVLPMFFYMLHQ